MVLPTCTTLRFFFQMCFALYASRATLGLRHYDLKLLNFLVAPVETNIYARYHLADAKFDVQLYQEAVDAWIKLTDFGTSHMEKGSLASPPKVLYLLPSRMFPLISFLVATFSARALS